MKTKLSYTDMRERQRHGLSGQINAYIRDIDSDITGFGKHNRLIVFGDLEGKSVTIREDLRGLPMSTERDRRKIVNGWVRQHPRGSKLVYVTSEGFGNSVFHEYLVVKREKAPR